VPISELILRENYHMDVTGKQIADWKFHWKTQIMHI
jgi:hypothetical protein